MRCCLRFAAWRVTLSLPPLRQVLASVLGMRDPSQLRDALNPRSLRMVKDVVKGMRVSAACGLLLLRLYSETCSCLLGRVAGVVMSASCMAGMGGWLHGCCVRLLQVYRQDAQVHLWLLCNFDLWCGTCSAALACLGMVEHNSSTLGPGCCT